MPESAAQQFAKLQRLTNQEAVDYLAGRGQITRTFSWQDLWHEAHGQQFTVSRLARLDLLQAMQDGINKSVNGDLSRRDWMRDTKALLKEAGWWGEVQVLDPASGEAVATKFDSARLKLIYDTNTRMAYSAGQWERAWRNRSSHPYIRYITKGDERVRATHRVWNNLTLPVDDPFWERHWPPNAWRCRCRVVSLSQAEYDKRRAAGTIDTEAPPEQLGEWTNKRTGEVSEIPAGIAPGFDYNPGLARTRQAGLDKVVREKLAAASPPLAKAAQAAGMTPSRLLDAFKKVASEIANEPREHLVLLDRAGDELARAVGTEDMVQLPAAMMTRLADGGLIHNHPGPPQSFSVDDVKLAIWHQLRETHVVDKLYHYTIFRPPETAWSPAYWVDIVEPAVDRIKADVIKRLDGAQAAGLITQELRNAIESHMIWEELDAEITIGYSRKLRSDDAEQ